MKIISMFVLLFSAMGLTACSTFEIEGRGSVKPDAITGSETVHGSLYGFQWSPFAIEKCGDDNLFRVEYHTNAALLAASVLSLGLYVPQTVEWWCDAGDADDEDEEAWDPEAGFVTE